jgi:sulfhydrogenase subunit beta (sulfur reductase)
MENYFITGNDFDSFLSSLIEKKTVVGPVAKKTKFVFAKLSSKDQLRLDYDVTILPPKKEFFPPKQTLITFKNNEYQGQINPEEKILFGVHFYDIKGLSMTDFLYAENNKDNYYCANREAATIVGSNIQSISPRAFWGSVGKDKKVEGHDAFLTKIKDGYVFEVLTDKGKALLEYGNFNKAEESQVKEAVKSNADVMNKCKEKLNYSSKEIAEKVRAAFKNTELWSKLAEKCFSCGSCNIVCPTCYCFDVQDKWNVDQVSGDRTRYWDACLTEEFAKISLGAGAEENFREKRGDRFRHRIMRKAAYLNEKLGSPACVGCGRCSVSCTSDIADPVEVINKVMEA